MPFLTFNYASEKEWISGVKKDPFWVGVRIPLEMGLFPSSVFGTQSRQISLTFLSDLNYPSDVGWVFIPDSQKSNAKSLKFTGLCIKT